MHDVTLVYTEYNHRLEVWVLGKRAANTTADRQQYPNTSKVCDDTMSMFKVLPHEARMCSHICLLFINIYATLEFKEFARDQRQTEFRKINSDVVTHTFCQVWFHLFKDVKILHWTIGKSVCNMTSTQHMMSFSDALNNLLRMLWYLVQNIKAIFLITTLSSRRRHVYQAKALNFDLITFLGKCTL